MVAGKRLRGCVAVSDKWGYRTFASSQAPGKVDRFLPATWHLSRPPTRATSPSFAGGVLPDTEERPHDRTDFKFQASCEARPPGVPAERGATGGLFPAGPLVMHRLEAPSRPGSAFHFAMDLLRKSGEFPMSYEELDDTAATVYEGI